MKKEQKPTFSFFLTNPDQLNNETGKFQLTKEDLTLVNPNTKTCPIFATKRDLELTKKIYKRIPVLINEAEGENPWNVRYLRMFDMTNDSHLFRDGKSLEESGFTLEGNIFRKGDEVFLPLYEGKMMWHFNHRAGSVEYKGAIVPGRHDVITSDISQLKDPNFAPLPRFWVNRIEVERLVPSGRGWLCGFRDITNAMSERTSIFSITPLVAAGNKLPLLFFDTQPTKVISAFLGNVNSFVFDYITRQKLGGNSMNLFILKQLPVLPPTSYTDDLINLISSKVLELTYTSWDLKEFAREMGYVDDDGRPKPPFEWDEERRLDLQCELDAIYLLLYGVTREDAEYILETFPIVKRIDIKRFGEYRTKNLILKYYDEYSIKLTVPKLEQVKGS